MDVFDPDIPPARHIDRMLGGSLLPHRHLPVGQHAARDGKVFAVVELEAAVLFGVQQRRTGKIDLRAPEPFDFEQSPESEAAAAEAEGAAVFAQLRERGPSPFAPKSRTWSSAAASMAAAATARRVITDFMIRLFPWVEW